MATENGEYFGMFDPSDTPAQRRGLEKELLVRMETGEEDPMLDPLGNQVFYDPRPAGSNSVNPIDVVLDRQ